MTPRTAVPERTLSQRREALERANQIRSHRARLKRDLKAGRIGIGALIDDPLCASMNVVDALLALPKVGRVKALNALSRGAISPPKTLAGLTVRQRATLAERLPEVSWTR